jgi:hypothetical protein
VRSAEGKESEVQEGVCGGWYFVLATEREVPGGRRRLYHTRLRIDLGSIPGFIGSFRKIKKNIFKILIFHMKKFKKQSCKYKLYML